MIEFHRPASQSRRGFQRVTRLTTLCSALLLISGCASPVKFDRPSPDRKRPRVTAIRDSHVRGELHEELVSLRDLETARQALLTQWNEKNPLPGPLTMAKLEADLVAKYRANALEHAFTQAGEKARAQAETAALASSVPSAPSSGSVAGAGSSLPSASPLVSAQTSSLFNASPGTPPPERQFSGTAGVPPDSKAAVAGSQPPPSTKVRAVAAGIPDTGDSVPAGLPIEAVGDPTEPGLAASAPEGPAVLKRLGALENSAVELSSSAETPLIFDYPVTYNSSVRRWIHYFQTEGRGSFLKWLERSSRYLPFIQYELTHAGLPQDLAYVAMIESGFSPVAVSHASAKGLWQFIESTGNRYGLRTSWWIDERNDFTKSTRAAIGYMTDLYQQFNSWYLVAASYNMGENGVRRLISRYHTNNFWELADRGALPAETQHYVPKIIAAMLISKAPALYGFRDLNYHMPLSYEYFNAPGGTDLVNLAAYLGVSEKYLKELNPELIKGFIPRQVKIHRIRVPKGSVSAVADYVRLRAGR